MKAAILVLLLCSGTVAAQQIGYHEARTDSHGNLLPWFADDPAVSYDHCIERIWDFWRGIDTCCGGMPAYMVYRTWDDRSSHIGIGGDQFAMALSSWSKLYQYSGDTRLIENMRFIADYYL